MKWLKIDDFAKTNPKNIVFWEDGPTTEIYYQANQWRYTEYPSIAKPTHYMILTSPNQGEGG